MKGTGRQYSMGEMKGNHQRRDTLEGLRKTIQGRGKAKKSVIGFLDFYVQRN